MKVLSRENAPENELAFVTPVDTEQALCENIKATGIVPQSLIRVTDY